MLDFVTIGGATRDIFFKIDNAKKKKGRHVMDGDCLLIPYGEKLIAQETFYTYGGGAANASVCLARLGAKVGAVCNIGAEGTGSLLINVLKKEKVNTTMVTRDSKHHTGLSIFIMGADNEHTGFLERGANNFLKVRAGNLKRAKWLYISSLTGDAAKSLPVIFEYAIRHQLKVAFNPGAEQLAGSRRLLDSWISKSEILILNVEEAESLITGHKPKNKKGLLTQIARLGANITLITEGGEGSHAIANGKMYSEPALSTDIVDTTGAGDCFGATFAFSIAKGHDIRYSLKIAAINSASVVSKMGAQEGLKKYNELRHSTWL